MGIFCTIMTVNTAALIATLRITSSCVMPPPIYRVIALIMLDVTMDVIQSGDALMI